MIKEKKILLISLVLLLFFESTEAKTQKLESQLQDQLPELMKKVVDWRHDLHKYPELSNREFRTSKKVEEHLNSLDMEVITGVAHTGVIGILRGNRQGPMVALRADMDGLPVKEMTGLPYASNEKSVYNGKNVDVMHACGHDAHVAILMGVAEYFSSIRNKIPGSIMFIFQPAEEGAPVGEQGGARLMLKEGIWSKELPDVIFGLHVTNAPHGLIAYREGPAMAASDAWKIIIKGKQAHGSTPWASVDPIMVAFQLGNNLQTIVSRKLDLRESPAVISVGSVHGGVRSNIIPNTVEMEGTIRTFDPVIRDEIIKEMNIIAKGTAAIAGATAEVIVPNGENYPVTFNDLELTKKVLPILENIVGDDLLYRTERSTGAEDFSFFSEKIPGFYFFLGVNEPGVDPSNTAGNHSPYFLIDDPALETGVKSLSHLTLNYLFGEI
ncbi:uncharacterized protein METZ01_LOCUS120551 [marine metagenome]|uniref:Peptidase M20 dimerisation domain-containing protein n=1 Tax=marine metagenome TaxID=408172 RepID=A0A381XU19_9ZZZZ